MSIRFRCENPECGRELSAPDEMAGRMGECTRCAAPVRIPAAEPPAALGVAGRFPEPPTRRPPPAGPVPARRVEPRPGRDEREDSPPSKPTAGETPTLRAECGNCGCRLKITTHADGRVVTCPKCNAPVKVSAAAAPGPAGTASLYEFSCPNCGGRMGVRRSLIGRVVKCRECDQAVRVPGPRRRASPEEDDAGREDGLTVGDWLVCILLPCVGLIAGFVRLAQGKRTGGPMIGYSILAMFIWLALRFAVAALSGR